MTPKTKVDQLLGRTVKHSGRESRLQFVKHAEFGDIDRLVVLDLPCRNYCRFLGFTFLGAGIRRDGSTSRNAAQGVRT